MKTSKRNIFYWCLYDFANSFVFIVFLLYFSKWMVLEKGLSGFWYNGTFILGSIGLIFFAPWLGSKADSLNRERRYLAASTVGCFLFYSLAALVGIYNLNILAAALFFGLGNFFYQLSFVFYNSALNNLATPENHGKISGLGYFANYLGQVVAVLMALPLVSGAVSLGTVPILAPLMPSIIIFMLLSLPLIFKKEIFERKNLETEERPKQLALLKTAIALPGVLYFMLSFFFFSDSITTILNNFSIYTSAVFRVSDSELGILTLLIIVAAGLGSFLWGLASDRWGARKTLVLNLATWIAVIPLAASAINYQFYFAVSFLAGLSIGGVWPVSRQLLIQLVPERILNYAFGIYAISERAATFAGPLVWSIVLGVRGYRWAMFSMVFFQIIAVIFISKIRSSRQFPRQKSLSYL